MKVSLEIMYSIVTVLIHYMQALVEYEQYKELYTLEREQVLAEFQDSNPHLSEFEAEMERYERLECEITQLPPQQSLTAAIQLSNGKRDVHLCACL